MAMLDFSHVSLSKTTSGLVASSTLQNSTRLAKILWKFTSSSRRFLKGWWLFPLLGDDLARGEPRWLELIELVEEWDPWYDALLSESSRSVESKRPEENLGSPHL